MTTYKQDLQNRNCVFIIVGYNTVRNFVLRRRVNSDVNVIFDFIYDDIHVHDVLNHQMKILEVYRLWKYTCIVVLLLFYNLD